MSHDTAALAALIGSRICHDLISPIGAIHNGLELVSLTGQTGSSAPEMDLIQQSCDSAAAKIQFFRIAFGSAGSEQVVRLSEARGTLEQLTAGTRLVPHWRAEVNLSRSEVQLAYLAFLCLETALPMGGEVAFDRVDDRWEIAAEAPRISDHPELWAAFDVDVPLRNVAPAHVQFALLALIASDAGRRVQKVQGKGRIDLTI